VDFEDTEEEAAFRAEARRWLALNAPRVEALAQTDTVAAAKLLQRRKYEDGWACIRWPEEYGGRDGTAIQQVIWNQEEHRYELPWGVFSIAHGMMAPTLMEWGTKEQRQRYLRKAAAGEEIWSQLFSEPSGGSDLAAVRTSAVRQGDSWIVNGQKIWSSGAHYSDFGLLLARTDPLVPKHKGLTYFLVDMKSPGVTIRPIKQISGDASFNEVFFVDVRIPDNQRVGEVGQGWRVSLTTLMNERATIAAAGSLGDSLSAQNVYDLASKVQYNGRSAIEDGAVRDKLAEWYVQEAGLKYISYRALSAISRGGTPGPENSIGKLVQARNAQAMASFCIDLLEMAGALPDSELGLVQERILSSYMSSPSWRIAGGTDEIMKNILAERVLGLPQEPRVDKDVPYREVPTR
jgi:alkylation response protein AidB-like acyl-CoA dehydrogenase